MEAAAAAVPAAPVAAPASLYIGDLHPEVTDGQLFDAFTEFKSLASVRVCRDLSSGRSLCYGYVNFISPQDATCAVETMNHSTLNGKPIRVMWSHRDPDARRSGVGNVFVKNLSDSIDSAKLQDMFAKFGNISSCKVATSEDGKSKGYGFVQFVSEDSANAAIEKLNGATVEGKQIYVGNFMKKSDRVLPGPDVKYTNLYMKNLDPDITEEVLQEKFSQFGKIVSLHIASGENNASKGFGFVNYENPDDARRAMETMNGSQLGSKCLYVARAQKKTERVQILRRQFEEKRKEQILKYMGSNIYIKNIHDDVTDDELRDLFSKCGTITSAKLMHDDKGISKGFGFVCFSTPEEATKAVNTFHGCMFHRKPLYVAIAQRKEDRQAQLQIQYAQRMAGLAASSSTVIPGGFPHLYYTAPPGIVSPVPPHQGLMYPPLGMRPGWRSGNAFVPPPTRPPFQPSQMPILPNNLRQKRMNRVRVNGQTVAPNGVPTQIALPAVDATNRKRTGMVKYVGNGRRDQGKTSEVSSNPAVNGPENMSSMLAAASPQQQKQILGELLYPLVHTHKPELAAKITGMLLEMDNAELLLLLDSTESLAAKVEEAVQVLKMSRTKLPNQDSLHCSFLSAEVAVS